jgi:hypothetical protein
MSRLSVLTTLFAAGLCGTALAACPTTVPGTSSEAIRANAQRVLCLQEEVDERARVRQFQLELNANENAIQSLQLQRRFENLPRPLPPSPFVQPAPFVPN